MHNQGMQAGTKLLIVKLVSIMAGGGDLATGLLLVLTPGVALKWMGLPPMADPLLLQFVGVFVACVGASYFGGLISWWQSGSWMRLRVIWELTILFRLAAGLFVVVEIARGQFLWAWISVPLADWTWAAVQGGLLWLGVLEETP